MRIVIIVEQNSRNSRHHGMREAFASKALNKTIIGKTKAPKQRANPLESEDFTLLGRNQDQVTEFISIVTPCDRKISDAQQHHAGTQISCVYRYIFVSRPKFFFDIHLSQFKNTSWKKQSITSQRFWRDNICPRWTFRCRRNR